MEQINKVFKGKEQPHFILNPDDINIISVVLKNCKRVITNEFPWSTPEGVKGTLSILDAEIEKYRIKEGKS